MKTNFNATLLCDFYKLSHRNLYPAGTEFIYDTWTPRSNKHLPSVEKVVSFGFQGVIKEWLIDYFNDNFFNASLNDILKDYRAVVKSALGVEDPDVTHIKELHELGYLPIYIRAIPEGIAVPIKTPMMTIENTNPRFFWLTGYLETLLSTELWQPMTTASIANRLYKICEFYVKPTGDERFIPFMMHDFSLRGMGGIYAGAKSGAGHLTSFVGTDTVPAIQYLNKYYNADLENELVGASVNASEHSVMCAYGQENEFESYKTLIENNEGILSLVMDSWDLWKVVTEYLPRLKDLIMSKENFKLTCRPDSGNPVHIICGNPDASTEYERKGLAEILYEIFGGTKNDKGYIELNPCIGMLYGDSIDEAKADKIMQLLVQKGFAATNIIFGCGSFLYQHKTRDSLGFAMKATHAVINGEEKMLFKDPKTDDGTKRSQKGRVMVFKNDKDEIFWRDKLDTEQEGRHLAHVPYPYGTPLLQTIFKDGKLYNETSLSEIRERLTN